MNARHFSVWLFVAFFLIAGSFYLLSDPRPHFLAATFGGALLAVASLGVERVFKLVLPWWFHAAYGLLLFCSLFLGTVLGMYGIWHPWDKLLHGLSGVIVGILGVILINKINSTLSISLPTWLQVVFILMFGISIAFLWEVAEFASDEIVGTRSQHSNADTMLDMIYGVLGATVAAAFSYLPARIKSN